MGQRPENVHFDVHSRWIDSTGNGRPCKKMVWTTWSNKKSRYFVVVQKEKKSKDSPSPYARQHHVDWKTHLGQWCGGHFSLNMNTIASWTIWTNNLCVHTHDTMDGLIMHFVRFPIFKVPRCPITNFNFRLFYCKQQKQNYNYNIHS